MRWSQRDFWIRSSSDKLDLPKKYIVDYSNFSKVYETGQEIRLSPDEDPISAIKFVSNNNIYDLLPELAEEINKVGVEISKLNPLAFLKKNCHSLNDVFLYPDIVKALRPTEINSFWDHAFERWAN